MSQLQYRNENQNYLSNFIFQFIKKTKWHFGYTDWFRCEILILYLVYTFLTKKKNVVLLNGNRNLKIKFEFKIRNSIETKTKIWVLGSIFWKIENKWKDSFFKGSLGDVTDQRSASAQKRFREKRTGVHFSIFIENQNWDLKFVFRFDNENEKRKKLKTLFHFQTKIECPFRPTDWLPFSCLTDFFIEFLIPSFDFHLQQKMENEIQFVFRFSF